MDFFCEGPWFFRQTNDVVYPNQDISKEIVLASRRLRLEMMQRICGDDASEGLIRAYDYLTGISCHSISAMRELLGGSPRRIVSAHISPSGNQLTVIFDYADFNVVYEYLIDDNARFEAGFDVYSRDKMLRLRYDTPYIRNLPMVVELHESSKNDSKRVTHGPFYKDSFENELETFHAVITRGVPNKTSLSDSLADFLIFEEIVGHLAMYEKKDSDYI
jgi:myo-inositol 2-dehydrogenase/D-chiro-inositol 1-dehydrogenase